MTAAYATITQANAEIDRLVGIYDRMKAEAVEQSKRDNASVLKMLEEARGEVRYLKAERDAWKTRAHQFLEDSVEHEAVNG